MSINSEAKITQLADVITGDSPTTANTPAPATAVLRYGTITAVLGVKCQVDVTGAGWLQHDASYTPVVGDLVYLLQQGPVAHVGGRLGGSPTSSPVGVIEAFAGTTAPNGWLKCDGSAVSRTTYPALFTVCGTAYGAGDGSTTFNLPNLVDRMPTGTGTAFVRGETGGQETLSLTSSNLPSHTHTATQAAHSHSHNHGTGDPTNHFRITSSTNTGTTAIPAASPGGTGNSYTTLNTDTDATTATPAITVTSTGSGTAINTMSPYLGIGMYIVRALP